MICAEERIRMLEDALDSAWELVNASIWNLEQGDHDYCNDVTRVYDRLLERREELSRLFKKLYPEESK